MRDQDLFAGRFKVTGVREGGMAQVLICIDIHNGRFVAAKKPNRFPEYFSREARLWLGLGNHPNIVRTHTVHKIDGSPYLFMDFIGDSKGNPYNLRDMINKGKIPLNFIIKIGICVIRALRHAQLIFPGFVHRDLKPENILINEDGNIFVSDFGIGHLPKYGSIDDQRKKRTSGYDMFSTDGTAFTKVGSFSGTIGYAAPEQYIDSSSVTFRADMYSLGVILYEALTGRIPFNPKEIQEEGLKILQDMPDFDLATSNVVPIKLRDIIIKMLHFFPVDRPDSLDAIEKTLEHSVKKSSEISDKQNVAKQVTADIDSITISNRIYSLIQLDELSIARRAVLAFQRIHPWHFKSAILIRTLFEKIADEKERWKFLKEVSRVDFLNPVKFITVSLIVLILFVPMLLAYTGSQQALPDYFFVKYHLTLMELISGFLLISLLLIERYINARTMITLDQITLPGILFGIVFSFFLSSLGYPILAGSGFKSIAGTLIGFGFSFSLMYLSLAVLKKEGLGGGTVKLYAMIGSFTGLMIIPILLASSGILVLQGLFLFFMKRLFPTELRWVHDRLTSSFIGQYGSQIPTSNALIAATWMIISWPGYRYILHV